jgi:hypothetical protein
MNKWLFSKYSARYVPAEERPQEGWQRLEYRVSGIEDLECEAKPGHWCQEADNGCGGAEAAHPKAESGRPI